MIYQTIISFATAFTIISPNIPATQIDTAPKLHLAVKTEIDPRPIKIDAYFAKRDMPLKGYGAKFVEEADRCGLDWRLLAAIGVRESSGGKRLMNNNPFGWGSAKIQFKDFNEAIEVVTSHLCGEVASTARYYGNNSTEKKLYYYNGTVIPSYPAEVINIMRHIEEAPLDA